MVIVGVRVGVLVTCKGGVVVGVTVGVEVFVVVTVGVDVLVGVGVAVLVLVGVFVGVLVGVGLGNNVTIGGQPLLQVSDINIELAESGRTTTKLPEEICENVNPVANKYGVLGPYNEAIVLLLTES